MVLPEVSWSNEDFEFATDSKATICGGSLAFQQRFVDLAQGIFGEPKGGEKFTYYLLSLLMFYDLIGEERRGLYSDGRVFVKVVPEFHETTHAVVDLSLGISHAVFGEGIAEVFRDRYGDNDDPKLFTFMRALEYDLMYEKFPAEAYGRAGHFMSYALDVHGVEATVELLAQARSGDASAVVQAKVAAAFGMAFDDVLADYGAYPLCRHQVFRWPITECAAGAPVDAVGGIWNIDADMDCDDPDVLGPRVGQRSRVNVVEIPEDGPYRVSVSGESEDVAVVEIGHCSPGCAPDKGLEVEVGTERVLELRRGRYHVTSEAQWLPSGRLKTRIEAVGPDGLSPG